MSRRSEALEKLGITVQNLTDDVAERLGYEDMSGVVVTEVEAGSEADTKGVSEGLLIREVNRRPVKNIKDFEEAMEEAVEDGTILLLVNNGRYNLFIALNVPED
ncbi:MAG: PDZ domain-containing protein [Planctomycetota bacterium]